MRFFLRFLITSIAIYVLIEYKYLPGVTMEQGTASLFVFTFILGLVNLVLGGILRLITFPLRILSLGVVGFIISIFVVKLTDQFVAGFSITGWSSILIIALVMGLITSLLG